MSDNHYLTDVTVGAAFGTLAGLGLPWLLHYREEAPPDPNAPAKPRVTWQLVPGPTSATLVGSF
jgi:membrane-associated phospholipid phosphatase